MNSGMTWHIKYLASVQKTVRQLDPPTRQRLHNFLEKRVASLEDPLQLGKALKGGEVDLWRYRVGDYRIVCELRDQELVVLVVRVGHRREIYR